MNIWTGLLFLGGHITSAQLAIALTSPAATWPELPVPPDQTGAAAVITTNPVTAGGQPTWPSQPLGEH